MAKILVIDDEATMVQMVTELLRADGHEVLPFNNGNAVLDALEEQHPELVITDLNLDKSRAQGMDILRKARALTPPSEVIVVTAFGSVETAVDAMRHGAYDFVTKPLNLDKVEMLIARALRDRKLEQENQTLRQQVDERYGLENMIGDSPALHEVLVQLVGHGVCDSRRERRRCGGERAVEQQAEDRVLGHVRALAQDEVPRPESCRETRDRGKGEDHGRPDGHGQPVRDEARGGHTA